MTDQGGEKISKNPHGNPDLICTFQQSEDTWKTVTIALLEGVTISHETTTQELTEEPSSLEEYLQTQASKRERKAIPKTVGYFTLNFTYDRDGVLLRQTPVDGELQKYVPVTLQARIPYFAIYLMIARHARKRRMYGTIKQHFYWPHIENDIHMTMKDCSSGPRQGSQMKHKHKLHFAVSGLLEFVAIDVLGPHQKRRRVTNM